MHINQCTHYEYPALVGSFIPTSVQYDPYGGYAMPPHQAHAQTMLSTVSPTGYAAVQVV